MEYVQSGKNIPKVQIVDSPDLHIIGKPHSQVHIPVMPRRCTGQWCCCPLVRVWEGFDCGHLSGQRVLLQKCRPCSTWCFCGGLMLAAMVYSGYTYGPGSGCLWSTDPCLNHCIVRSSLPNHMTSITAKRAVVSSQLSIWITCSFEGRLQVHVSLARILLTWQYHAKQ